MHDWIERIISARKAGESLVIPDSPLPGNGIALSLAPHPDDPDAAGVMLRALMQGGWQLYWSIVASGWSGVEDGYVGPDTSVKISLREEEQRASARFFGLPAGHLAFLRLSETTDTGKIIDDPANQHIIDSHLDELQPDLVVLPQGDDSHPDHRLVYRWLNGWVQRQHRRIVILGNEDPKTRSLHPDLLLTFGEETAAWKSTLLECHRSQSARNQATRGITFAQRILGVNWHEDGYAERYQWASPEEFR